MWMLTCKGQGQMSSVDRKRLSEQAFLQCQSVHTASVLLHLETYRYTFELHASDLAYVSEIDPGNNSDV